MHEIDSKKVANKYKKMRQKRPKKIFLADEEYIETIDYTTEPQEDLFSSESISERQTKYLILKGLKKNRQKL